VAQSRGKAELDDGVGICVAKNKTLIEVFLFGNCTLEVNVLDTEFMQSLLGQTSSLNVKSVWMVRTL
jgi:hypothetical protein